MSARRVKCINSEEVYSEADLDHERKALFYNLKRWLPSYAKFVFVLFSLTQLSLMFQDRSSDSPDHIEWYLAQSEGAFFFFASLLLIGWGVITAIALYMMKKGKFRKDSAVPYQEKILVPGDRVNYAVDTEQGLLTIGQDLFRLTDINGVEFYRTVGGRGALVLKVSQAVEGSIVRKVDKVTLISPEEVVFSKETTPLDLGGIELDKKAWEEVSTWLRTVMPYLPGEIA